MSVGVGGGGGGIFFLFFSFFSPNGPNVCSLEEMSLGKAASGTVAVCKSQVWAILPANINIGDAHLHRY